LAEVREGTVRDQNCDDSNDDEGQRKLDDSNGESGQRQSLTTLGSA
jgi:hypothetical protein